MASNITILRKTANNEPGKGQPRGVGTADRPPNDELNPIPPGGSDSIFGTTPQSHMEYGLFIHLVAEAVQLLSHRSAVIRSVVRTLWPVKVPSGDETTTALLGDSERRVLQVVSHSMCLPIRVIRGSVHDLIAMETSGFTELESTHRFVTDYALCFPGGPKVSVVVHKFRRINKRDMDTILRCKISECLDLTMQDTCMLLNWMIPSMFIQSLRTASDMVDWSQSYIGQRSPSESFDPSVNWFPRSVPRGAQ